MGWDAYAVRHGAPLGTPDERLDAELRAAFSSANEELVRQTGHGSDHLRDGELGGGSFECFEGATPIPCYEEHNADGELYWPPETVLKAHSVAKWNVPSWSTLPPDDPLNVYDFLEARLFLEVCAAHRLGVWFTW